MKVHRPRVKQKYCVPVFSEVTNLTQFHEVWAVSPKQAANLVRHRLFPEMSYEDIYRDRHLIFLEPEVVATPVRPIPSIRQMELPL